MNIFNHFKDTLQYIDNLRIETDPEVLKTAFENGNNRVIEAIAENPNTPEEILLEIASKVKNNYNNITISLLNNPHLSDNVLTELSKTQNLLVITQLVKKPLPDKAYDNILNYYPKSPTNQYDLFITLISTFPLRILLKHSKRQDFKQELIYEAIKIKTNKKENK